MRHDLLALALTAALVGCASPPDETDDTEETHDTEDTGDTEVDPFCGDGVVDPDEQCDDGDLNGASGDCSDQCKWNGWVTCDVLAGPIVALDTTLAQPDGSYHVAGRFEGEVALDSSCVADADKSAVVTFTLPDGGDWLVTTAHPGTTSHVALSLRTDCDDRAEISCNLDDAPLAGTSQAFITGGAAGDGYAALLQLVDGDARGWQLSLRPITSVADIGDTCDFANPCDDGAICSDAVCVADTAPTITSVTLSQTGYYDLRVVVTGTDANQDVIGLQVPSFEDILGDTWGDDPGEDPLDLSATLTWSGTTFTYVYAASVFFSSTGLDEIVDADFRVVDRAGNASAPVNATWPDLVENEIMSHIGDPCDMCVECDDGSNYGYPRYCDPNPHADPDDAGHEIVGLVCTWNEATTEATCQDRNLNAAPVLSGGAMWWEGPTAMLRVEGFDAVHDSGVTAHVTIVYADTTTEEVGEAYFSDITWDRGDFVAWGDVALAPTGAVDHLEVRVEDRGYPSATSDAITIEWVEVVPPTTSAYGEGCDLRGWDSVCAEPYVCSPTLSGIPACSESRAPILHEVSGEWSGSAFFSQLAISFDGEDRNADWYALVVEPVTYNPRPLAWNDYDSTWSVVPFGRTTYAGDLVLGFGDWLYLTWLEDADGNASNALVLQGIPTQETGETCSTGSCNFFGCTPPLAYCDVAAGDTCSKRDDVSGTVQVCETAVAPTLTSVVAHRIDSDTLILDVTGSDPNGDTSAVVVSLDEDGVISWPNATVGISTPVYGATQFTATVTVPLTDPLAVASVDVHLKDWAFLGSQTITVAVPPILLADEACSNDDTVDTCWEGSECQSGSCFAYEPQIAAATIAFDTTGRDGVVTVTGYDDQTGALMVLKTATVTIGGRTFTRSLSKYNTTWTGNAFSFTVDAPGVGTGDLVGERFIQVDLVDVGGFGDSGLFFVTPHRAWGDACDPAGATDRCHAGLACDSVDAVCVVDTTDACAGVPLTEATSDHVTVTTSTGTKLENYPLYAECGASNQPNGKEAAIVYTATQSGTLTITSTDDPSDGSVIPGYLFVRYDSCVGYDAIATCSNLAGSTNTVSLDVEVGDVLYVVVDGPSFPSGGPVTVDFSYE